MATDNASFILQEMEIVLGIPKQDPTFFNLDFLTYTGIVPDEWELVGVPKRSPQLAQISFDNNVSLTAAPQQTIFSEVLGDKNMESISVPQVALRFIDIMKNLKLTSLTLNFRGYVAFPNSPRAAHDYFFKTLFQPGAWQSVGTAPIRAGIDLVYTFDQKLLNLTVMEAAIRRLEDTPMAALVFKGEFANDYSQLSADASVVAVRQGIQDWNRDLKLFIDVVSRFFRQESKSMPQSASTPTTIPLT